MRPFFRVFFWRVGGQPSACHNLFHFDQGRKTAPKRDTASFSLDSLPDQFSYHQFSYHLFIKGTSITWQCPCGGMFFSTWWLSSLCYIFDLMPWNFCCTFLIFTFDNYLDLFPLTITSRKILGTLVKYFKSYRGDLDGLWQGQLGDGRGCGGWDAGPSGVVLLAGWVLNGCSQELSLGLLDQQLLLCWSQGQLKRHQQRQKYNIYIINKQSFS